MPGGEAAWGALRRTSSSTDCTAFLPYLNLASTLLSFVHKHVLLRRSDLAAMLGEHFFGIRPPRWRAPPPPSSIMTRRTLRRVCRVLKYIPK